MIKEKNIILVVIAVLFILFTPTMSNAAKVKVEKVSKLEVTSTDTSTVKLKWKKVKNVKGYKVYKYNYSKKKYELCATTSNTSVKIKKLKSSQKNTFKVRAYKISGKKIYYGAYSSSITTATTPDKVQNIKVNGQDTSTISLTWNKIKDVTAYSLYLYNNDSKKYEFKMSTKDNSAVLTGLYQAKKYSVKIRAYKKVSGKRYYGKYSDITKSNTTPGKVTGLKAYDYSLTTISLAWDVMSNDAIYMVYMYNPINNTEELLGESNNNYFLVSGLKEETEYCFKVLPYINNNNQNYYGQYSEILKAATCPNRVTGLKIKNTTTNSIEIEWNKTKDADGYAVYVFRESYQSFVLYKTTTSTKMKITGLGAAKFYKMYVKSYSIIDGKKYYSDQSQTISQKTNSTDVYKAGIDVSQHQDKIDWNKVKEMGVDFAILRLGWIGNKNNHTLDTQFERNYNECRRLKIPVGVYIYCYSSNTENIKNGADWTIKKLNGRILDLPVFIDMEDSSITKAGKNELSNMCVEYNTIIANAGYKPGIYANKYWFDTYLEKDLRTKYTCWIAHYTSNSSVTYEDSFKIWQYSSSGKVYGITGNADVNVMYVKEEEINPSTEDQISTTTGETINATPEQVNTLQ